MAINREIVYAANQSAKRRRRQLDRIGFRRQVYSTVNGLACSCVRDAVNRGLNGYRLTRLNGYRLTVLDTHNPTLSGLGQESGTLALEPVSDKKALENAIRYFQRARATVGTLKGLGDTAQAQSAASYAAAGAKVGSIVPGIGTVIGAVVGAVVGWIAGKSKPVRPSAEQVSQCRAMLTEYMSFANQSPNAPIPMEWQQLLDLNWCTNAVYGGEVGNKDPRFFNPGFESGTRAVAIAIVKKIYETPVGQTVNLDEITFKSPSGKTTRFGKYSFVNPTFTDLKSFSERYFEASEIESCKVNASKYAGGCQSFTERAERRRLLYDLLAWAARTTLPNISESDLKAASQVATETGSSAKDVVTAVQSIINRDVVKGETSLLLTGQTDTPVQIPGTTPGTPPVTELPQIPGMTQQTASDITELIKSLVSQGQQNQEVVTAALNELNNRGVDTVTAKPAVEQEVAAQTSSGKNPLLIGGLLAAGLLIFAMPSKKVRRR